MSLSRLVNSQSKGFLNPISMLRACIAHESSDGGLCFTLNEQQTQIKEMAAKVCQDVIMPNATKWDQTGEYPWEFIKTMHEVGILHPGIPQEFNGPGLGLVETSLIVEEVCYGCSGCATAQVANLLGHIPLFVGGNTEQKKKYFGRMFEEPMVAALAVTEPGGGSDVSGVKTKGEKKGDEYIVNGQKMWISNGSVCNWYFLLAKTEKDAPPHKSFTGFIIERETPGIIVGKKEKMMGQRCSDTRGITFEDVRIPKENVLGKPGDGFKLAMAAFDRTRPAVSSGSVGLQRRCLDESIKYALERKAFGTQIFNFQPISFMIAEMAIGIELTTLAYQKAAWLCDHNKPFTYIASVSKAYGSDAVNQTASNTVQIFGGNGYNTEYGVEKFVRDAKLFMIYEGTSQIQRNIISKEVAARAKSKM